jgi:Superinfection immunity protein
LAFAADAEYYRAGARTSTGDGILDNTTTVIVLLLILLIYLLPTLIAYSREHPRRAEIVVVNIFLGWTLIGWIAVFLWAALAPAEEQPA